MIMAAAIMFAGIAAAQNVDESDALKRTTIFSQAIRVQRNLPYTS